MVGCNFSSAAGGKNAKSKNNLASPIKYKGSYLWPFITVTKSYSKLKALSLL